MISQAQLREYVIKPSLMSVNLYSEDAEELLMFTCSAESLGGFLLKQVQGPALGIYQMEPNTYHDIWRNFIFLRPSLNTIMSVKLGCTSIPEESLLITDLRLATVMTRINYLRVKDALPKKDDVNAIWAYYKQHYNTPLGKATKEDAIQKYLKYAR